MKLVKFLVINTLLTPLAFTMLGNVYIANKSDHPIYYKYTAKTDSSIPQIISETYVAKGSLSAKSQDKSDPFNYTYCTTTIVENSCVKCKPGNQPDCPLLNGCDPPGKYDYACLLFNLRKGTQETPSRSIEIYKETRAPASKAGDSTIITITEDGKMWELVKKFEDIQDKHWYIYDPNDSRVFGKKIVGKK